MDVCCKPIRISETCAVFISHTAWGWEPDTWRCAPSLPLTRCGDLCKLQKLDYPRESSDNTQCNAFSFADGETEVQGLDPGHKANRSRILDKPSGFPHRDLFPLRQLLLSRLCRARRWPQLVPATINPRSYVNCAALRKCSPQ